MNGATALDCENTISRPNSTKTITIGMQPVLLFLAEELDELGQHATLCHDTPQYIFVK